MDNEKLIEEVDELLDNATELISQGKNEEASAKIAEAKKKLRPVGSGTNGPRPKK